MEERIPAANLDNQLCFAMYDASRAAIRAYAPLLADLGLTYPQYLTMFVLWETDQPVSVGDLGARLHLDTGTLSPLLKRLERLGFVDRQRDPTDDRRVLISLTPEGSGLRERACDIPAHMTERFGLDPAAGMKLRDELIDIVRTLEAHTNNSGA